MAIWLSNRRLLALVGLGVGGQAGKQRSEFTDRAVARFDAAAPCISVSGTGADAVTEGNMAGTVTLFESGPVRADCVVVRRQAPLRGQPAGWALP